MFYLLEEIFNFWKGFLFLAKRFLILFYNLLFFNKVKLFVYYSLLIFVFFFLSFPSVFQVFSKCFPSIFTSIFEGFGVFDIFYYNWPDHTNLKTAIIYCTKFKQFVFCAKVRQFFYNLCTKILCILFCFKLIQNTV